MNLPPHIDTMIMIRCEEFDSLPTTRRLESEELSYLRSRVVGSGPANIIRPTCLADHDDVAMPLDDDDDLDAEWHRGQLIP